MRPINPGGGGTGGGGGFNPPNNKTTTTGAINLGLVTSTGGLLGLTGALLVPGYNPVNGQTFIYLLSDSDFNCEESSEYDFRQETEFGQFPGQGRICTINSIVLKYRELGKATFNLNVTVFSRVIDDFITTQIPVNIPVVPLTKTRINKFPDKRIHTVVLHPKKPITGEMPQVTFTRDANSGPMSATTVVLRANADETSPQ